ncbi:MAG: hypothetical protein ABIH48_01060 [Candidatus Falkowbacteria bacterium]
MTGKASITDGQARSLGASFLVDTPWDNVHGDIQPFIELSPSERGKIFVDFLQEICERFLFILITTPFNPAEFIGKGWSVWKGPADSDGLSGDEAQDERALVLTKIKLSQLIFESCLKKDETLITGDEKLRRLQEKQDFILLGANAFLALWEDYQAEDSFLEQIYKKHNIQYLDFFGTILRDPRGYRYVLCLCRRDDGRWCWYSYWLSDHWGADSLSVGCASSA